MSTGTAALLENLSALEELDEEFGDQQTTNSVTAAKHRRDTKQATTASDIASFRKVAEWFMTSGSVVTEARDEAFDRAPSFTPENSPATT